MVATSFGAKIIQVRSLLFPITHYMNFTFTRCNTLTTAIYSNRIADKNTLEATLSLPEIPDTSIALYHRGTRVLSGYDRIVYGDHGPYLEFSRQHLCVDVVDKYGRKPASLPPSTEVGFYYLWLQFKDTNVKVYWQIKDVSDLPNAPRRDDGLPSRFNRREGYADYKRGFFYVDPYTLHT
jgi:hypothetical protein